MDRTWIAERVAELYSGEVDWRSAAGRVHVAAVHDASGCVLAIGPAAPRSAWDRFVLGFARARADVIVTTGSILRSEPDLVHRYAETAEEDAAFAEWRRDVLGRSAPPRLLVLSASGVFPVDHPALRAARGWIWTSSAGRDRLGTSPGGFEYAAPGEGEGEEGIGAALSWAAAMPGVETLTIEAGPSAMAGLHAAGAIDELLLSRFEGEIADAARGPAFVETAVILDRFGAPSSACRLEEESGVWRFERWRV